ncbi:hypothetical protein M419DRAFT_123989 [Trichoderma reesei RUT C-30]|uniref:Uncharacterized protein n=1 Tax=Hypocrea jecorina (strain ATCC 56765 / BCRC 32924 / NRRL 11460 / Rut C-30) TaxID=1344414 RepID=A0A024S7F3_HYPJR|nr:hypothetical protein M419DRAFT_123989 [Trichoderma reesei RUT C-30]
MLMYYAQLPSVTEQLLLSFPSLKPQLKDVFHLYQSRTVKSIPLCLQKAQISPCHGSPHQETTFLRFPRFALP